LRELRPYYPELEFVEVQHDRAHLPLLVVIPPKRAVGKAVGSIKANPSKRAKEKVASLRKGYGGTDGMWSDGYFGSAVGVEAAVSQRSIEHQGQEDAGQAQLELW
jgi:putative transposase